MEQLQEENMSLEDMMNEGWFDWLFRRRRGSTSKAIDALEILLGDLETMKEEYPQGTYSLLAIVP
jgi:hypothetical protein